MTAFYHQLWHAFWKAGLAPVPEWYRRCSEEIRRQGAAEHVRLAERLGPETWACLLAAWGRPNVEDLCTHQLGSGRMQTEFVIAPLGLPAEAREPVVRLGALGNLIVALYDDLLDETASDPLSRPALLRVMRAGGCLDAGDSDLSSATNAVARLVGLYFEGVSALTSADAHPSVHRCLSHAIVAMYDAERQTLTGASPIRLKLATRRKSALPAVVMGLPAWLVSPDFCPRRYLWHLRWLYAFGDFCGLVDDALDLAEDARVGHPNCVQGWLDAKPGDASGVAARIASYGRRLRADWDAHMASAAPSLFLTETMPTCLGLAFGGSSGSTDNRIQ